MTNIITITTTSERMARMLVIIKAITSFTSNKSACFQIKLTVSRVCTSIIIEINVLY